MLYTLLNDAENKRSGQIDTLLKPDADMRVIINHIRRMSCAPALQGRYLHLKTDEFLIGALDRMHAEKKERKFTLSASLIEKAEELEFIIRHRYSEPFMLTEISKMLATNVQYIRPPSAKNMA